MKTEKNKKIKLLKDYFQKKPEVIMAFVFGSQAKGLAGEESDFDVAIWLADKDKESQIWSEIAQIIKREVDLILLDEAPATLVSSILRTGIPLTIKDNSLFWDIYLQASREAEDFLEFCRDFWGIYQRSKSLVPGDEARFLERIQFLHSELQELDQFQKLSFQDYQEDKAKRRNIEKWVENICNATLDIAKIVLASEKKRMPKTYRETLYNFGGLVGATEKEAKKFSKFADLRNILAHEYLDIIYQKIQGFLKQAPPIYKKIFSFLEANYELDVTE